MARIAFLGLGNMGRGMASRLIGAGNDVALYNRTRAKAEAVAGARVAATPRDAADGAVAIISMVGDDAASGAVWLGPDGALEGDPAPDAFAIECSTLSHDWVIELADLAARAGLRYIDCPVTGLPEQAAAGEIMLLAGAARDDLADARALLAPICRDIVHFGAIGSGTAYKLMVNLMGSIQIAAVAEAMVQAEAAGLDLDQVAQAFSTGAAASPQVIRNARRMAAGDHDPAGGFAGRWRLKDTLYGVALARKLGVSALLGEAAVGAFQSSVDKGFGDANESRVIDALRQT
jgi:3-hydroxyisobutyrate dehydrogenase